MKTSIFCRFSDVWMKQFVELWIRHSSARFVCMGISFSPCCAFSILISREARQKARRREPRRAKQLAALLAWMLDAWKNRISSFFYSKKVSELEHNSSWARMHRADRTPGGTSYASKNSAKPSQTKNVRDRWILFALWPRLSKSQGHVCVSFRTQIKLPKLRRKQAVSQYTTRPSRFLRGGWGKCSFFFVGWEKNNYPWITPFFVGRLENDNPWVDAVAART